MEVYVVKVTLLGTSPPVWRRILVPRDVTLQNLHRTLQTVMGGRIPICINLLSRDRGSLILDPEFGRKREQDQARGVDLAGGGEAIVRARFRGRPGPRASS